MEERQVRQGLIEERLGVMEGRQERMEDRVERLETISLDTIRAVQTLVTDVATIKVIMEQNQNGQGA